MDNSQIEAARRELMRRRAAQELARRKAAAPQPQSESRPPVDGTAPAGPTQEATTDRGGVAGAIDAFGRGVVNTSSLGFGDELGAGARWLGGKLLPWQPEVTYDEALKEVRGDDKAVADANPGANIAGNVTGALWMGSRLMRAGLSPTANAINSGAGLGRVSAASAGEGAVLGGVHGLGSGEGVEGRLKSAGVGSATGLLLGSATPAVVAGASKLVSPFAAPVMARAFPERYAERAIGEGVRRSGMTVDDIAAALGRSQADDQGMFTVADAMGNSGQRMLSTVARTPNNERQAVVEALQARQAGQGDRLSNFLAQGFDAPDTAAQRAASLTAQRTATGNTNYTAAREGAGAVNLNGAIDEIDSLLGRDPILGDTALSVGPLGPRLRALRDQLQRDGEQLVDFDRVLNIKSDLYQQMQRNPQVANEMRGVYNYLDQALENASSGYRSANDTFRQQSRAIDAVETGRAAASGRMRADDTVPAFNRMTDEEQSAFRAGYVDPLITRVESASMSPTTNKARGLITPKTGAEFPAFAAPNRADQLAARIMREQRMFETANQALGGSKTADNLADAAEMSKFDPGVMSKLFRGDVPGAVMEGGRRLLGEAQGMPPRVIEQVSQVLMETRPEAARQLLNGGLSRLSRTDQMRARLIASLISSEAAGAGRLGSP